MNNRRLQAFLGVHLGRRLLIVAQRATSLINLGR
jgi:hypothetical protein